MKNENEKNMKKVHSPIKFIGIFFLIFLLIALNLIHYDLGKIDYQQSAAVTEGKIEDMTQQASVLDENQKASENDQPESSKKEIAALEQRLMEQTSGMEDILFDKNVFNILLIGYDSRDADGKGRSDTNILVSINRKTKRITMTSIMRDSYVEIPGYGNNRINAAYAFGGGSLLVETIEKNFQISVNNYVAVDFFAFMDIINIVGGVEIEVSDAEVKVMNRYIRQLNRLEGYNEDTDILSEGGTLLLNGKQTLAYTRVRYVGNADFERTERQRTVLEKVFEKTKSLNLLELNDLMNRLLPEISTDMDEKEVLFFLLRGPLFLQYDLQSLRIPADGTYEALRIDGMEVLGVDLEENRKLLEEMVYESGQK